MKLAFLFVFRLILQIAEKVVQITGNRTFIRHCFSVFFTSLVSSKLVHLYANRPSISIVTFLIWGSTFFLQDAVLISLVWLLAQPFQRPLVRIVAALVVIAASLVVLGMASANISFFVKTGAEVHWRLAKGFHTGPAEMKTLLSELASFLMVLVGLLGVSWLLAPHVYKATDGALDILYSSVRSVFTFWRRKGGPKPYEPVSTVEDGYDCEREDGGLISLADFQDDSLGKPGSVGYMKRLAVLGPTALVLVLSCFRPNESSYSIMSMSLPLLPITSGGKNQPVFADVRFVTAGENYYWIKENATALATPPEFDFLPSDGPVPGFKDWTDEANENPSHYSPDHDPLHISNLHKDVLEPLREALNGSVKIKHVFLIKMESTRGDVFPFRKDSFLWDRIAGSFPNNKIPIEVENRLANMTRTAEHLTGFNSGLEDHGHRKKGPYGGISASNAFTTGTYTLKSIPGTVCGVTPLVVDFNKEYKHHIPQPCLPQIFDVFNRQPDNTDQTDDFTSWPWHSMWMQSVTDTYDHQGRLMTAMGYNDILKKEVIEHPSAKHYPPKSSEVNYYGYPDSEIKPYLHDAIRDAQRNNKRMFLTHLTGTTHHAWGIPNGKHLELIKRTWYGGNARLNRYLNTILFQDRWMNDILEVLEDTGIANETLIVFTGDHGLALANDGSSTPYDNPHVKSFHTPLIFSHPHLPPIHVDHPVSNSQVLPTILDLLIESSSLSPNSTHAAKQLLPLYEGQSMIRPLIAEETTLDENQKPINKQDWQFTVMNTGGSWLALRSASKPDYRVVIPLRGLPWRFTDLKSDPNETNPLMEFEVVNFVNRIEKEYGKEAADWVGDATRVTLWWIGENHRRWKYSIEKW